MAAPSCAHHLRSKDSVSGKSTCPLARGSVSPTSSPLTWSKTPESETSPVLARMLISMVYRRCGMRSWRKRNREGQGQKTAAAGP